jgi:creatinine amidohydrolase
VRAIRLTELHPHDLEALLSTCPGLVLPLGTIEWHGHHLPLGLDGIKAEAIADEAAVRAGAVLAPTSWFAADGVPQPFTLRLPRAPVRELLELALCQFAGMGFSAIAIANGHYGLQNSIAVREAALTCMDACDATVLPIAEYEVLLDLGSEADHAGVFETSLMQAMRPDLVRLPDGPATRDPLPGVLGADPRGRSSAGLGRDALAHTADRIAAAIARALEPGFDRDAYRGALAAGLEALRTLEELRSRLPRDQVPPPLTPSWRAHLLALDAGAFDDARAHAAQKRDHPAT